MFRPSSCVLLTALVLLGCQERLTLGELWEKPEDGGSSDGGSGDGGSGDGGSGDGGQSQVEFPLMGLDCGEPWVPTRVMNCSQESNGRTMCLTVDDFKPGGSLAHHRLRLEFQPEVLSESVPLSEGFLRMDFSFFVGNTHFGSRVPSAYVPRGSIRVHAFDPYRHTADVEFEDVIVAGENSGIAGDPRCSLDGHLRIHQFQPRTELGERCGSDFECGGLYFGRVCDPATTRCAEGCFKDLDCPPDAQCDVAASRCRF